MRPDSILRELEKAGFRAYYVGGCVRDTLLGRPVHDWDITTSASPEEMMALFPDSLPTGVKHGTVTVRWQGVLAETTTFRSDGAYSDARHPESVTFVRRLEDDLARRDFTVNAMAMDLQGNITDLFGGREDLANGLLRCVGTPEARFSEDALRMLRACRFCAQLGFAMEPATDAAITACAPLAAGLSRERVREEVEKTLLSPRPEYLNRMLENGLLAACTDVREGALSGLAALPEAPAVRWAAVLVQLPQLELSGFRLPARLQQLAEAAAAAYRPARSRPEWKALIAERGWECADTAAQLCGSSAVEEIRRSGECVTLRQLAVTGRDFPDRQGPEVGRLLQGLLQHVLRCPEDNRREILLSLAQAM